MPANWRATLLAVDGAVIDDIPAHLSRLPREASHLILSVGGNDLLANLDLMSARVNSVTQSLEKFRDRLMAFEGSYRRTMTDLLELGLPTTICTIYNGNLSQEDAPRLGLGNADIDVLLVGLAPFNDVILRVAFENRLDVIDLRLVCSEPEDYANPIEPSSHGGQKIADAIVRVLALGDSKTGSRVVC